MMLRVRMHVLIKILLARSPAQTNGLQDRVFVVRFEHWLVQYVQMCCRKPGQ